MPHEDSALGVYALHVEVDGSPGDDPLTGRPGLRGVGRTVSGSGRPVLVDTARCSHAQAPAQARDLMRRATAAGHTVVGYRIERISPW